MINDKKNSAFLTCLQSSSAESRWKGSVTQQLVTRQEWPVPLVSFFNCLPHFNRSHLSLFTAKRHPVEILMAPSQWAFNTSHNTTSTAQTQPSLAHTQTHTQLTWLLSHAGDQRFSRSPPDEERDVKGQTAGLTFRTQHFSFSMNLCYSHNHPATNLSHTAPSIPATLVFHHIC